MFVGALPGVGIVNSVTAPALVIRPILLPERSVNHRFPSEPAAIPDGWLEVLGMGNSVTEPDGVTTPILFR